MNIQKVIPILMVLISLGCASWAAAPEPVSSSTLKIEGISKHPVMALTPAAIERGRENYKRYEWARAIGDDIVSSAAVWLERDLEWIRKHMPGQGACFAYGFAGCPECGGKTGIWASSLCSFDKPGRVNCANGHLLPNDRYSDAGTGYRGEDGRMHYFVGVYNAWAIEQFVKGAYDLAYAYSLTGDTRYASRCAEILDCLALIYPTCTIGSWDYPETRPGQNSGRFNRPQYQVGRVLITLASTYDQVFHAREMEEGSVREGLTRRENIERNMLLDGAWYCYEKSFNFNGLTNGEADYIKGAMVVGVVLGVPEYVHWAVDGPYGIKAMLANNIGRDGTYYETATGYSYYTRAIYRGFAEYLLNYRGSAYPNGVDLYSDDRFCSFMALLNLNTQIGGAMPSYGDAAPTTGRWKAGGKPFEKYDFECLEYLRLRVKDPVKAKKYTDMQRWLSDGYPEKYYEESASARWFLFHGEPLAAGDSDEILAEVVAPIMESRVLGQKGFAILRAKWAREGESQGALVRYGPALNHANFDDLNFTYHAMGEDVTYDLGYALASAHVFAGWSKQTASHQLVTVNEKSQGLEGAPTGGSLLALWQGEFTAAADVSAPGGYKAEGVKEYGRTLFLVGDPGETEAGGTYLVDIFRVSGGKQHDSFTHAPGREMNFGGVDVSEATSGSLAGKDVAWGDKVLVDGDIDGQSNKPYWIAPPGNGYGFLMEPRVLTPEGNAWWTDWTLPKSGNHVRLWYPEVEGERAVAVWGPGILKDLPDAGYVVRRRSPSDGRSVFVTVWEPYGQQGSISGLDVVEFEDSVNQDWPAVAINVKHKDGRQDMVYSAGDDRRREVGEIALAGRLGRVTFRDGEVVHAEGLGLSTLEFQGEKLLDGGKGAKHSGKIGALDLNRRIVETSTQLADSKTLAGKLIYFNNTGYTRNTVYEIENVDDFSTGSVITLTESWELGGGVVDSIEETSGIISSLVSHEYAKSLNKREESGFFTGKRLVSRESGASARILKMGIKQPMTINVDKTSAFKVGERFAYEDIAVGDDFVIFRDQDIKD